jgi:hypothetical protein
MPNARLFPTSKVQFQNLTVNGRAYSGTPGNVVDVSMPSDADYLGGNGWTRVGEVGTTAQRPKAADRRGQHFIDTTLSLVIVSDGVNWRNPITAAIV